MVTIGIVGVGPRWEDRYRPVLANLKDRIRVAAVYDAVSTRAEQIADELQARTVGGILELCRQSDVQAVLLLDSGWPGTAALSLLSLRRKPIYIANRIEKDAHRLKQLYQVATSDGLTLMPEFGLRYTPAANRLQELLATRFGPIESILVEAIVPRYRKVDGLAESQGQQFRDLLIEWFDWCWYLIRSAPTEVFSEVVDTETGGTDAYRLIRITFGAVRSTSASSTGRHPVVQFHLRSSDLSSNEETDGEPPSFSRIHVVCQKGTAVLKDNQTIAWEVGSDHALETLSADRSEVEVMLDHFCRRVVGGLIPVADLNDVCRGIRFVDAAERSLRTGKLQPPDVEFVLDES